MVHKSIGGLIPQLANHAARDNGSLSSRPGGQNFTHCCLVAINQSLTITGPDRTLSFNTPSYFLPSISTSELESILSGDQNSFPCGASWRNPGGDNVPVIRVPYDWCLSQCGGWEMSNLSVVQQWVVPLVLFILPSLAFCLNIPRASKLATPDVMSPADPRSLIWFATYWVRLLWAMLLTVVDTLVWLSICFAFAGPMILSAMYEYVLDRKVLEFLDASKENGAREKQNISSRLKAQLLLAVAVGNLRISTGRRISILSQWDAQANRRRMSIGDILKDNTWTRVMAMIDEDESDLAWHGGKVLLSTKLKALLDSQSSFGATIGAPILFFIGGFIYTLLGIKNGSLRDDDTVHALAFGMWWMTVPHLAIVSCSMLASPSPSALQGIVWDGGAIASREKSERGSWDSMRMKIEHLAIGRWIMEKTRKYEIVKPVYDGQFKTVTLWNRGPNKKRWVDEAVRDYATHFEEHGDRSMPPEEARKRLSMSLGDHINIGAGSAVLLILPSLLASLTSYKTPREGISCRSGTYLIYSITQVVECLFWVWEGWLKRLYGERWSEARTRAKTANWCGQTFVGFFAIFTAVVGTLMQLLGVYRTCACKVPVSYWLHPEAPGAYVDLSTGGTASIRVALQWWVASGWVAVGFICVVCALAWWHQRRLRRVFRAEADSLNEGQVVAQLTLEESYEIVTKK